MTSTPKLDHEGFGEDGSNFVEFRRKMKYAEVLSSSMEKLLRQIGFTGKVSIQVQNGQVLKSGYEEGYFRQESRD
ncbi:MAG: hypothetical protein ACRD2S_03025 [Terriglobales bacterium]